MCIIRSDQISRSVVSYSLRPHESQHARPHCQSPTPGVHLDSHPSNQWCHTAISSSVVPFSSCPQSLPASLSPKWILKETSPGCSLEGLMLRLKLQNFGHLMWKVDWLEKTLIGGIGGRRRGDDRGWDGCMASPTRCTWVLVNSGSWWWTGRPGVLRFMGSQRVRHDWVTELNWI